MKLGLEDKVVFITGGGSGIGLATARAFHREGAVVVVGDLNPDAAGADADDRGPFGRHLDVTTSSGVEDVIGSIEQEFGRIDVLVNNVGIAPFRESFLTTDLAEWHRTMAVNFYGMVRAARAVIPGMVERGSGAIVSVASDAGTQPDPFFVDYAVSKAAVLSLSKSLSIEFGPSGIRSNCVSPGPTLTPAMDGFIRSLSGQIGKSYDETLDYFAKDMRKLPLGRMNDPSEVANVIVFLASDAAVQVTGSAYRVDAGAHVYF